MRKFGERRIKDEQQRMGNRRQDDAGGMCAYYGLQK